MNFCICNEITSLGNHVHSSKYVLGLACNNIFQNVHTTLEKMGEKRIRIQMHTICAQKNKEINKRIQILS